MFFELWLFLKKIGHFLLFSTDWLILSAGKQQNSKSKNLVKKQTENLTFSIISYFLCRLLFQSWRKSLVNLCSMMSSKKWVDIQSVKPFEHWPFILSKFYILSTLISKFYIFRTLIAAYLSCEIMKSSVIFGSFVKIKCQSMPTANFFVKPHHLWRNYWTLLTKNRYEP